MEAFKTLIIMQFNTPLGKSIFAYMSLIVDKYFSGYSGIKLFNISHAGVFSKYSIKSTFSIFSSSLVNNLGAFI
jgi:hypothetical protein